MKKLYVILFLLFITGCTDAEMSQLGGLGARHKIQLWSCGQMIGEWTSTGKVNSVAQSDGFYFQDEKTHTNVEITGTIIITRIN